MEALLYAIDWSTAYRPATWLLLSGQSPYNEPLFYNPPWALLPLIPLALLPEPVGRVLLFVLCLILAALAAVRMGAGRLVLIAFLLSPPVVMSFYTGNLDALVLLGATLTPWLGLFFISLKPQVGAVLALFWLVEAWQAGGPRQVARTFTPISIAFLLSFAVYGPWLLDAPDLVDVVYNTSLFPLSLAVGLPLAVVAFRERRDRLALGAGPFLSPYLTFQSWAASLTILLNRPLELIAAVIGLWITILINMSS